MSASGASRAGRAAHLAVLCILQLAAVPALAQEPVPGDADDQFPLGAEARTRLAQLQVDWLNWLVACNESDGERAAATIESLLAHTRLVGMEYLPELSMAASRKAIEAAERGDLERARWGLEAADRLDPGRPEGAFAAARVALAGGQYVAAVKSYFSGLGRSARAPQIRYVLLNNVFLWLATVLTLTGLLLVGVLMAARGPDLYFDLYRYFNRYAAGPLAHLLCLVLLSWPFLLPAGVLWIAIYWSVLLWAYGGRLERVLLIAIWLFVGSLPVAVTEQGRRVGLALYPPVHALQSAALGRLEGDLFSHLARLQSILPESAALEHFGADIHRKLGQMERARALYREVLSREPSDAAALNDIGIYYFDASDFAAAADFFSRAAESRPEAAEIHFNLAQAHSELYRFEQSEAALLAARAVDSESVNRWLQRGTAERVVPINGGLARVDEIRSELRAQWKVAEGEAGWFGHWRRALSLPLVAVFVLIAIVIRLATRRGRTARPMTQWWRPGFDRLRRVVLAGVPEAEVGRSGKAAVVLLVVVALATLPLANRLGYGLPWLHAGAPLLPPIVAALGLALFFGLRYRSQGRGQQ